MALAFDAATHTYTLDGLVVPSVTQILKAVGLIDFSHVPLHILAKALDRGTQVHRAVHFWNDRDLDVDRFAREFPDYAPYLDGWRRFCEQRHFVPFVSEHRVASRLHQCAGTLDCLGLLDGEAVLLDFATGHPHDVAKDLQTAAYYALATEWRAEDPILDAFWSQQPVIRRHAVALKRTGTFTIETYSNQRDYRTFLALLEAAKIVFVRRGERWEDDAAVGFERLERAGGLHHERAH